MIGNSGFKHHLTACEKRQKLQKPASAEKKEPQEAAPTTDPTPTEATPELILPTEEKPKKNSEDVVYIFDVLKDSGQIKQKKDKDKNWAEQAIETVLEHSEEIQVFLAPFVLALAKPPEAAPEEQQNEPEDW